MVSKAWKKCRKSSDYVLNKSGNIGLAYMEKILQITKAPIAKIWHVLEAKSIAALEKYVSVSRFDSDTDCI